MTKKKSTEETSAEVKQRYVDILTNGGFKAFFGDKKNKKAVIDILNVLLPAHRQVEDIDYLSTEQYGQTEENKEFRYDFMCRDKEGVSFIVEAQRYKEADWFRRCVGYASRMYDLNNESGGSYDIPPVYLIGLMGVDIEHPDMDRWHDRYISEYTFREKETHELLDETIFIIFAELNRFGKRAEECENGLDRMLYVLRNSGELKNPVGWLNDPIYARILRAFEIAKFSKAKRIQYNKDMYDERRRNGEMKAARQDGLAEGLAEGLARGREEGREEGIALANFENAKKLKALGVPQDIISQATGLTADEVAGL